MLALPAGAQAPDRTVTVRADRPHCAFEWHYKTTGDVWTDWQGVPAQDDAAVLHLQPGSMECEVRVSGGNLFYEWHGHRKIPSYAHEATVTTEGSFRYSLLLPVVLLGSAGLFVRYWRRYRSALVRTRHLETLIDSGRPERIGSYRIVDELGSGGMARVYRGVGDDGKAVAIKVPHASILESADARQRFNREMKLGTSLVHPGIVRIEAFSPAESDKPFMVMELVAGKPLENPTGTPCPVQETLQIADRVLDALSYCHERGIIHRDIKPSNIMMTASGPKLMDFGIARSQDVTAITVSNQIIGTPLYMPREQIQGQPDARSDLYALGMVVFERLLGRSPIDTNDVIAVISYKMCEDVPSLGALRRDLPADVAAWVDRMCATEPAARFQTAADARAALQPMLQGSGRG